MRVHKRWRNGVGAIVVKKTIAGFCPARIRLIGNKRRGAYLLVGFLNGR